MQQEKLNEKCYRCRKILIEFYELKDTESNKKFKLCKECGNKLVKWLKNYE